MNMLPQTQQEESEDALERCKKECQEALKVSEAVSQKLAHELYDLKEDHIMQIQTMSEKYHSQLSSIEKEWKNRLKSAEDKWEERLENEAATSSKQLQTALDELRNSLLNSFAEEKLKVRISPLHHYIYNSKFTKSHLACIFTFLRVRDTVSALELTLSALEALTHRMPMGVCGRYRKPRPSNNMNTNKLARVLQ